MTQEEEDTAVQIVTQEEEEDTAVLTVTQEPEDTAVHKKKRTLPSGL